VMKRTKWKTLEITGLAPQEEEKMKQKDRDEEMKEKKIKEEVKLQLTSPHHQLEELEAHHLKIPLLGQ
jgi:uncharacterized Fe-S cluster-containing protein